MVTIQCPKCGAEQSATPGQQMTCPECGFGALVPVGVGARAPSAAPVPPAASPPPVPPPRATERPAEAPSVPDPPAPDDQLEQVQLKTAAGPFGYLLGVLGFITFWLAAYVLPFLLGAGAIALGVVARKKNPADRRGVPAMVLGGLTVAASVGWLAFA